MKGFSLIFVYILWCDFLLCIFYCNGVILVIEALDEMFTTIMIPMLKLHTNYGFHELFLNQLIPMG
jgi:hypothetical protein